MNDNEDVISVKTIILKRIIQKAVNNAVKKKYGFNPDIRIDRLELVGNEKGKVRVSLSGAGSFDLRVIERLLDEK